jgi:hypothetical protein
MADMHVITGRDEKWSIVMHFAVPDSNNAVAVNYRTAIINSGIGGSTVLIAGDGTNGTIVAAESANIDSGAVYEHVVPFIVESGGTSNAELRATLRALYASEETTVINRLKKQLRYFGHTESKA